MEILHWHLLSAFILPIGETLSFSLPSVNSSLKASSTPKYYEFIKSSFDVNMATQWRRSSGVAIKG